MQSNHPDMLQSPTLVVSKGKPKRGTVLCTEDIRGINTEKHLQLLRKSKPESNWW